MQEIFVSRQDDNTNACKLKASWNETTIKQWKTSNSQKNSFFSFKIQALALVACNMHLKRLQIHLHFTVFFNLSIFLVFTVFNVFDHAQFSQWV